MKEIVALCNDSFKNIFLCFDIISRKYSLKIFSVLKQVYFLYWLHSDCCSANYM